MVGGGAQETMSTEPDKTSPATAWTISIVAALVLYVLSIGPVVGLLENGTIPQSAESSLEKLYTPVLLLAHLPGGGTLLGNYFEWWIRKLQKPAKP
jgi:hypothetical protein